jgi:hypothetical protein
MSQGSFSFAAYRQNSRFHVRMRNPLFSGCLLRLSPDCDERVRPAAFRPEKCRRHLPALHAEVFCRSGQPAQAAQPARPPKPTLTVYMDDIVVKAPRMGDLIATLDATFANLWRFNIKLNPEKCTFMVPKGKLLGYIVYSGQP